MEMHQENMSSCHRLFQDSVTNNCESDATEDITVQVNDSEHDIICENQPANNVTTDKCASNPESSYKDVCTCCKCLFTRDKVRFFDESKYDVSNSVVHKVLSWRVTNPQTSEMICKSCNQALSKNIPTLPHHWCANVIEVLHICAICSVEKV